MQHIINRTTAIAFDFNLITFFFRVVLIFLEQRKQILICRKMRHAHIDTIIIVIILFK